MTPPLAEKYTFFNSHQTRSKEMCSGAVPFKYIKPVWHKTKQQPTGVCVCAGCELLVKQQATGVCPGCELLDQAASWRCVCSCEFLDQAAS